MTKKISVLISGPILSRATESEAIRVIKSYWAIPGCTQVVLSTYAGETTPAIREIVSIVIENPDPGPDFFGAKGNPIKSNLTRLLKTTNSGLSQISEEITIKTRIEIWVSESIFLSNLINAINSDNNFPKPLNVIAEHMYPTGFRLKNPLYWCPDTFQVGFTQDLKATWNFAMVWWLARGHYLTSRKFSLFRPVQIANEQVIGIGLSQLLKNHNSKEQALIQHRFSFKFVDAYYSLRMQHQMVRIHEIKKLGIQVSEQRLLVSKNSKSWQRKFTNFQSGTSFQISSVIVFRISIAWILCLISWAQKAFYFSAVWLKHRKYP